MTGNGSGSARSVPGVRLAAAAKTNASQAGAQRHVLLRLRQKIQALPRQGAMTENGSGSVRSVPGVRLAAASAGFYKDRLDAALIELCPEAVSAGGSDKKYKRCRGRAP